MTTSNFSERVDEPAADWTLSGAGVVTWLVRGVEYPETDSFDEQLDGATDDNESLLLAVAATSEALLGRPRGRLTGATELPLGAVAAASAKRVENQKKIVVID